MRYQQRTILRRMNLMNRKPAVKSKRRPLKGIKSLPFTRQNYYLFLIGLAVIALGYLALSRPPTSNFWSLTVAPILLVLGYCVIIPVAIMWKGRKPQQEKEES